MKIKTFEAQYELIEFCHYIDRNQISVLELSVNSSDINFLIDELSMIFVIEAEKQTYIFSGYEVSEYYEEDNGLTKIICVK